jgi:predicted metalloprotease with PDZ domain
MPYRLDRRNHTRSLWVFEGITSYYQDLFLLRSGLIGAQAYLQRLGEQLTRVYRTPGRFRQSLAASSFDAWDFLYKPDPNSANVGVSYYTKGALVALALDLTLRAAPEPHSLDEVMRALWQRYGALDIGVPEDGFERLALEIGGPALATFFATAVHGTEDLPLGDLLGACGIKLNMRAASGAADPGGTPAAGDDAPFGLGAAYRSRDGGLELTVVLDNGAAQAAGLCPGDLVVAIGGLRVGERNLASRLAREDLGASVRVTAFRGDELIEVDLVLTPPAADTCYLEPDTRASNEALARRRAWLGE